MPGSEQAGRASRPRWLLFEDLEIHEAARTGTTCRVVLRAAGHSLVGETVAVVSSETERCELVARATVTAIGPRIVEGARLSFGGVAVISPFGEDLICVLLIAETGQQSIRLVGSCARSDHGARAAAFATLDAANRWLEQYSVLPLPTEQA